MKMNLRKSCKSGFTLIELLVVVAIISLLSSIIMASLNSSRGKSADSLIQSSLLNIRSQAEIVYTSLGCYGDNNPVGDNGCVSLAVGQCSTAMTTDDTLFANPLIATQITAATTAGNGIASSRCATSAQGWAIAVQLKTSDGNTGPLADSWCVDSTGTSKSLTWTATPSQLIGNAITGLVCT